MSEWYTIIPGGVLSKKELSSSAKVVYGAVCSFTANRTKAAFPSHDAIAERAGLQTRSISRLVKELADFGLLKVTRRGRRQTNTYEVSAPECDITELCHHNPARGDDAGLRALSIKRIPKKSTRSVSGEAEEIYEVYALKIKSGAKEDAVRSIGRLLKEGYSREVLKAAINRYAATEKGRGDVKYRYQANNFFGRNCYFKEYLGELGVRRTDVPRRELTPEEQALRQRLIDAGQAGEA